MKTPGTVLEFDAVSAGYGLITTIREVSLSVTRGDTVVIIGPNGAGKSTLLKAVYGQSQVQSGHILFNNGDVDLRLEGRQGSSVTRLGLNYVPQRQNVFPTLSVHENLEVGAVTTPKSMRRRVAEIYQLYPKLGERRRQRAGTLSGGERQLLAVGRALMTEPQLLLLDEPSAALSPVAAEDMFEQLLRVKDLGVSMLMVEQNARQALAIADYAYVLEGGVKVLEGKGEELLDDPTVESLYLGGHVDVHETGVTP